MRKFGWLKVAAALGLFVAVAAAQETAPRKQPRGFLPDYLKNVVEEGQREPIYAIQKKYTAQIDELEAQIDALEAKRDAEILATLNPEQRAKYERFKKFFEAEKALEKEAEAKAAVDAAAAAAEASAAAPKIPAAP